MIVLEYIIGFALVYLMGWGCWQSTLIIDERRKAWRAGTHDYYGNPIDNDET